jgi:hypothetical protein
VGCCRNDSFHSFASIAKLIADRTESLKTLSILLEMVSVKDKVIMSYRRDQ